MATLKPITRIEQFLSDIIDNGGGGGGGSGGNVLVVNVTVENTSDGATATFDKTFEELKSAYEGGAVMLCNVTTEDNVNSVYGDSIAFLDYSPEMQFPFPAPEEFSTEASFLQVENDVVHCYFVNCGITAEGTSVAVQTVDLISAN